MSPVIEARSVGRTYRQQTNRRSFGANLGSLFKTSSVVVEAVKGISFQVAQGEAIGYLGVNGAGKSTMIKMLTGILAPTSGSVAVFGRDPHKYRRSNAFQIGTVFGQRTQLWWDLPVIESLNLQRYLYGIETNTFSRRLDELIQGLDASSFVNRPARQLSLGQRMRGELILTLLHEPRILFLDEPTIGLDVFGKDALRRFLRETNQKRATTIFLSSHDLGDVESICTRVMLVDHGDLVFDDSLSQLGSSLSVERVAVVTFDSDPGELQLKEAEMLEDGGRIKKLRLLNPTLRPAELLGEIEKTAPVADLSIQRASTEDAIRSYLSRRSA